jgi:hypothetical protein
MALLTNLDDKQFQTMVKHEEPSPEEQIKPIDWKQVKLLAIEYFAIERQVNIQRIYHGMKVN